MKYGVIRSLAAIGLVLICSTGAWAQVTNHYAVSISSDKLYVAWAEGQWAGAGGSSVLQIQDFQGASLSGIATHGEWIYILDSNSHSMIVGKIVEEAPGRYSWRQQKSVALQNSDNSLHVDRPKSLSVDSAGNVYVIGERWSTGGSDPTYHSNYAYVSGIASNWSNPIVTIGGVSGSSMADVAAYGSGTGAGAIVSHIVVSANRATNATGITPSGNAWSNTIAQSYNPGPVATATGLLGNPLAYVTSHRSSSEDTNMYGSLDVINTETGNVLSHYNLSDHIDPQDVAVVNDNGTFYLMLIGTPVNYKWDDENGLVPDPTVGPAQAWKVQLGADGLPMFTTKQVYKWSQTDNSFGQTIICSEDGTVVWSTQPAGVQQLRTWQFADWGTAVSPGFSGSVSGALVGVAHYDGFSPVPEPSALASLAGLMGAGAFFVRRRRA